MLALSRSTAALLLSAAGAAAVLASNSLDPCSRKPYYTFNL